MKGNHQHTGADCACRYAGKVDAPGGKIQLPKQMHPAVKKPKPVEGTAVHRKDGRPELKGGK